MTRSPPRKTTHRHIRSPGKATFLNFMLARLLAACQVVVMCDNSDVYLFYCGQVYSRPAKSGFWNLPTRKGAWYCPIWALIDVDYQSQEPPIPSEPSIWPIQASSQNPARWKSWSKQNGAPMLGMPLWSEEELMSGCAFSMFSLSGSIVR